MKTFTLDEAQALVPVLESLLKRAIEAKTAAESIEPDRQRLAQRVFLTGGMNIDWWRSGASAPPMERHSSSAPRSVAEIDAIGVQVKDLDTGLLDFPSASTASRPALLADGRNPHHPLAHRSKPASAAASPSTNASNAPSPKKPTRRQFLLLFGAISLIL